MKFKSLLAALIAACFSINVFAFELSADDKQLSLQMINLIKTKRTRALSAEEAACMDAIDARFGELINKEIVGLAEASGLEETEADQKIRDYLVSEAAFLAYAAEIKAYEASIDSKDEAEIFAFTYRAVTLFEIFKYTAFYNSMSQEVLAAYQYVVNTIPTFGKKIDINVKLNENLD